MSEKSALRVQAESNYSPILGAIEAKSPDAIITSIAYYKYKIAKREYITKRNLPADSQAVRNFHQTYGDSMIDVFISEAQRTMAERIFEMREQSFKREEESIREGELVRVISRRIAESEEGLTNTVLSRTKTSTQLLINISSAILLTVLTVLIVLSVSPDFRKDAKSAFFGSDQPESHPNNSK